jgi:hypothetical protein
MKWDKIFIMLMIGLLSVVVVTAVPTGPSATNILSSSRYGTASAANLSAIAGNVTEINFNATAVTQTWQGYFGNITGTIVLGNSNNQTLYNWNSANPSGEIYATRSAATPTWASIKCANQTEVNSEDTTLATGTTDADRVNYTFLNTTVFSNFYVGTQLINRSAQDCYAVRLYNSTAESSSNFQEVLLSDTSVVLYTALLTQDSTGFDGATHDFEMLVGENGHSGDSSTTPYYFYLEIQ